MAFLYVYDAKVFYGRSCLLRSAVGVLRATLSLRCNAPCVQARMPSACLTQKKCFFGFWGLPTHPPPR